MKTKTLLVSLIACFSLNLGAGCVSESSDDDIDLAEQSDDAGESKFDFTYLDQTELNIKPINDGSSYVKIIKSKQQFDKLFGANAAPVDFSKEWVAVFAAGPRNTGGHSAHIDAVTIDKQTITLITRTEAPGPACLVTQAQTFPTNVVTFTKPTTDVTRAKYTISNRSYSCKNDF